MVKVAVFLACFNGEKWIEEQIKSILCNETSEIKISIFLSDDCSEDRTLEIVSKFVGANFFLLPFPKKNLGSAALNFYRIFNNVNLSGFDYIFLSDQDDVWLPNKVSEAIHCLNLHGKDCYASALTCFDAKGKEWNLVKSEKITENDYLFQSASAGCTYAISNKAAACVKEKLSRISMDELQKISSHDWFIYAFTRSMGFSWFIDKRAFIRYRQHENNAWGAGGLGLMKRKFFLIRNNWYRSNVCEIGKNIQLTEDQKFIINSLEQRRYGLKFLRMVPSFRRSFSEKIKIALMFFLRII